MTNLLAYLNTHINLLFLILLTTRESGTVI
jgi:hypothetical protein